MKIFEREYMLVDPVIRYFAHQSYTRHECELQFYDYRMDVYGFSSRLGLTVAIELKLFKWRRALKQALPYQLCADLVYLAMPKDSIRLVDLSELQYHNIGLIAVGTERCREILSAERTFLVRPHYRDFYVEHLGRGD